VRFQIHQSAINKRIISALGRSQGRKLFHHYNNGLLITCKNYKLDRTRKRLTLNGPQIINGCQTVRAICEAYEDLTPEDQKDFRKKTRVQTKIIKTTDPDLIGNLVITTNDQNPMKPRNLKSNTAEQRNIQRLFRDLPIKWFYERKEGEFKSLESASTRVRWFHRSDYAVGRRRYRVIDNQDLAKAWYAFIGYSDKALIGGINYFEEEPLGVYNKVFKSIPTAAFWGTFSDVTFIQEDQYFEPSLPSVHQILLAHCIREFIKARTISSSANRKEALLRGIQNRQLNGDRNTGKCTSDQREISEFLSNDIDYNLNNMMNNMKEIMIELFAFVLTKKYSTLEALTCQGILSFPNELEYNKSGFDGTLLPGSKQDGNSLIGPIFEFLKDCATQYYFTYEAEIKSTPRIKSYLSGRGTINKFRQKVVERNNSIIGYDAPWKKMDKTFIESLPELPSA